MCQLCIKLFALLSNFSVAILLSNTTRQAFVILKQFRPGKLLYLFKFFSKGITAWKVSKYGVIFGLNTGKYGPEITPYLNTFCAVYTSWTHDVKWVYIRRSEPFHSFFLMSYVRSIYVLYPGVARWQRSSYSLSHIIWNELVFIFSFHLFLPEFCVGFNSLYAFGLFDTPWNIRKLLLFWYF